MDTNSEEEKEHVFQTRGDAERFVAAHFCELPWKMELDWHRTTNDVQLIEEVVVEATAPPGGSPVLVPRFRWVIKNDDLNLADAILEGLRAAASAGLLGGVAVVAGPAQWGAVIGLFTTIFKLCRNVIHKGKVLEASCYTVLSTVKADEPISGADLLARVKKVEPGWTVDALEQILATLKAMPMRDGIVRQLVSQDGEGRWLTAGL